MRLILGECIDEMKCLISKGVKVDAIITDPPYFEIKGGFDFIYKSKEEFLIFFEEFVKLAFEILKDNGTFLFFGHWRNVAYKQVIADKYFKLENNGVWEKVDAKTKLRVSTMRSLSPITERFLVYSKETEERTGTQIMLDDHSLFLSIKEKADKELEKVGKSIAEIESSLNVIVSHFFGYTKNPNKTQFHMLTESTFEKLKSIGMYQGVEYSELKAEFNSLKEQYEPQRLEHENKRRPFKNPNKLHDVIKHSQESHISKKYNHPTQKPIGLIKKLIEVFTREGQTILDPFMGAGSTGIASKELNRNFIGIELEQDYFNTAKNRIEEQPVLIQLSLK